MRDKNNKFDTRFPLTKEAPPEVLGDSFSFRYPTARTKNPTQTGIMMSKNGNLKIDWDNGKIEVLFSKNGNKKIEFGNLVDGFGVNFVDTDQETFIDSMGLVSTATFPQSNVSVESINQPITTAEPDWTDLTNASFTFTLERSARVLTQAKVSFWGVPDGATAHDSLINFNIDGSRLVNARIFFSNAETAVTGSMHRLVTLEAGEHTIKLQGTLNRTGGTNPILNIYNYYFTYLVLGK